MHGWRAEWVRWIGRRLVMPDTARCILSAAAGQSVFAMQGSDIDIKTNGTDECLPLHSTHSFFHPLRIIASTGATGILGMLVRWLHRQRLPHLSAIRNAGCLESRRGFAAPSRLCASPPSDGASALTKTRNIGIIAHIDAVRTVYYIDYLVSIVSPLMATRARRPQLSVCSTTEASPDE